MKKLNLLLTVFCLWGWHLVNAQTTFQKSYGAIFNDEGRAGQQTSDGGYIFVGTTQSFGAGGRDVYLIKTNVNGVVQWSQAYGRGSDEWGYAVQQTTDGGYIIAGTISGNGAGGRDAYLIKTDANGNLLWSNSYGGNNDDEAYSVEQTTDGGYVLAGYTRSFGGGRNMYIVKTTSTGTLQWSKSIDNNGGNNEYGRDIRQTADGGYICVGYTDGGTGNWDVLLVKLSANGSLSWGQDYGAGGRDRGYAVQELSTGGYILTGTADDFGPGNGDVILMKTDASGNKIWSKAFGGPSFESGYAIQQMSNGNYVVAGETGFGAGGQDCYVLETDTNGNMLTSKTFGGGGGDEMAYGIQQTTDGGFIISASTQSFSQGNDWNFYLIKTDAALKTTCNTTTPPTATISWSPSNVGSSITASNPATTTTTINTNVTPSTPTTMCVCSPVANFASTAPQCSSLPVDFTNLGSTGTGLVYSWTFGSGASSATSSLSDPTGIIYSSGGTKLVTFKVSDGACSDSISQSILIHQTPSANFTSNTPQCTGSAVNFTNTGSSGTGFQYFWDFGAGASPATSTANNPSGILYSTGGTKTVTLTITNQYGCDSTITKTITINATPKAAFTSTAPRCTGLGVNFTDTGDTTGVTFSWNFGSGASPATASVQNPTGVVYSTGGTKTVSLILTNSSTGCSDTAVQTINIHQTPTAMYTSNAPVCSSSGADFTNTGSTGSNWSYSWDFGTGAVPATSTSENPTGVMYNNGGVKTVTFTISDGSCTQSYSDTIRVNATPKAAFTSTAPRCTGLGVNFTDTGDSSGVTFSWDFGSGATPAASSAQNPSGVVYSTAGIKTVTLILTNSATGCSDTAVQTINIHQTPTAMYTSDAPVCAGTGVNFSNTGSTGSNWSYSWDFGVNASPATSTSENPGGVTYANGGTKTVTFTISDGSCTQSYSDSIVINPLPVADAGPDTTICANTSVQIGSSATSGYAYTWFPINTLSNANIANPVASPIAPVTNYIVTVTNTSTGCQAIDSAYVTMLAPLVANAGVDAKICRYDSVQIGTGLLEGQHYAWTPAAGLNDVNLPNPVASPDSTTTYTLTVTGANCNAEHDQVTVTVHQLPNANAGKDDSITHGSSTQLVATGGVQYNWSPFAGLDNPGIYNPIASPDTTTSYTVKVTDIYGCINRDTVKITVIAPSVWVPNAFTPDGNGENDIFYVRGEGINNFQFGIFDRSGDKIFYSNDMHLGWDGTKQSTGEKMPEGAYVYYVKGTLTNGKAVNVKGIVNLIR